MKKNQHTRNCDSWIQLCECLPLGLSGRNIAATHHLLDIKVKKKTLERVKRSFYWYGLTADVLHYVATCAMCGSSKKSAR